LVIVRFRFAQGTPPVLLFGTRTAILTMFLQLRLPLLGSLIILPHELQIGGFMRVHRIAVLFASLLVCATPCFAHHMAVVVNKENNVANLTSAHLARIFRAEIRKWPDGKTLVLILHRESVGETETLERLNRVNGAEWKAFIDAHKNSILFADSDAEVLKIVQSTPGAIGLVDVRSVDDTINVVRVDGKLPTEAGYLPH
jgi:hypothetical protein